MNDAYRGALMLGASMALYLAFILAVTAINQWRSAARRHIGLHVVFMTVGLCVTASLIVARAVVDSGTNSDLEWWDIARGVQVLLILCGLYPLRAHQKQMAHRKATRIERPGGPE